MQSRAVGLTITLGGQLSLKTAREEGSIMKVFVTGAAGFVGAQLSRTLLGRGDTVVGFDNLNDYYPVEHKRRRLKTLKGKPGFTFIEGDLRDATLLKQLFAQAKPDAVAHLAAMAAVRYSVEHPLHIRRGQCSGDR